MYNRKTMKSLKMLLDLANQDDDDDDDDRSGRSNSSSDRTLTVETVDNHVYFYADVDSDRVLALIRAVKEIDKDLRNERLSRQLPDDYPQTPIWLHIHSGGGDTFAGLSAADQLATIKTPIFSIVEGVCASAATLISIVCQRRYIMPNAFMLFHQFSSMAWGTHEEFKDEMRLQEMLMGNIVKMYKTYSKMEEDAIRDMLRHDFWMNAQQSLENGFVDEIGLPF